MKNIDWALIKAKLKEAVLVLPHFARNPVQFMRALPDWDWPTMLVLQGAFAAACGVLANLLERHILGLITGIGIAPLSVLFMTAVGAGIFHYTFMFFFKREVPYRQIYLHMIFASIPFLILNIAISFVPPIPILGAAAMFMLLFVGFVSNFNLERVRIRNVLAGLLAVYVAYWVVLLVRTTSTQQNRRIKATPESMDILEKELNLEN